MDTVEYCAELPECKPYSKDREHYINTNSIMQQTRLFLPFGKLRCVSDASVSMFL